jgi:hypothetical protein
MAIGGLQFVGVPTELVCQLTQPPAGLVMGQARCKPADMAGAFTETDKIVSGRRLFRHLPSPEAISASRICPFAPSWRAVQSDVLGLARSSAYQAGEAAVAAAEVSRAAEALEHAEATIPHEGARTRAPPRSL